MKIIYFHFPSGFSSPFNKSLFWIIFFWNSAAKQHIGSIWNWSIDASVVVSFVLLHLKKKPQKTLIGPPSYPRSVSLSSIHKSIDQWPIQLNQPLPSLGLWLTTFWPTTYVKILSFFLSFLLTTIQQNHFKISIEISHHRSFHRSWIQRNILLYSLCDPLFSNWTPISRYFRRWCNNKLGFKLFSPSSFESQIGGKWKEGSIGPPIARDNSEIFVGVSKRGWKREHLLLLGWWPTWLLVLAPPRSHNWVVCCL